MRIQAVVGGFHLVALPPLKRMSERAADVAALGREILDRGVEVARTGHCTGDKAFDALRSAMAERIQLLHAGKRLEF
jgi:metal-dependent hydrolase (beta-lactamase superfamily II)